MIYFEIWGNIIMGLLASYYVHLSIKLDILVDIPTESAKIQNFACRNKVYVIVWYALFLIYNRLFCVLCLTHNRQSLLFVFLR